MSAAGLKYSAHRSKFCLLHGLFVIAANYRVRPQSKSSQVFERNTSVLLTGDGHHGYDIIAQNQNCAPLSCEKI